MDFKKGDRVVYQHTDGFGSDTNNGRAGMLTEDSIYGAARVKWDDGKSLPSSPHTANLRLVPAEFKVGDRVLIAKKMTGAGCPSWNSAAGMDQTIGKLGTVLDARGYVRVRVDGGTSWFYGKSSLEHVLPPSEADVAKALATLQMAGSVTFKPTRPPFEPSTIKLNSQYTAEVTEKGVTVGCQTFSLEIIDKLAVAVDRALAYNNMESK